MDRKEAYSRFELNLFNSSQLVELANLWLEQGIFCDALNELCSLRYPQGSQPDELFKKAMVELGEERPTRLEAAEMIIANTLNSIINGDESAVSGAMLLYNEVYDELEDIIKDGYHPREKLGLQELFYLGSEYDEISAENQWQNKAYLSKIELKIKEEAESWLNKNIKTRPSTDGVVSE